MPSMYNSSVSLMLNGMKTLSAILTKAESHLDADSLASLKLIDDMLPLSFQIQMCSNVAKKTVSRLTGADDTPMEDNEKTLPELQKRIADTIALLEGVTQSAFDGCESKQVELKLGPLGPLHLSGEDYVFDYALPNFYFHASIAYAILRAKGVPLGKGDWLGASIGKHVPAKKE